MILMQVKGNMVLVMHKLCRGVKGDREHGTSMVLDTMQLFIKIGPKWLLICRTICIRDYVLR